MSRRRASRRGEGGENAPRCAAPRRAIRLTAILLNWKERGTMQVPPLQNRPGRGTSDHAARPAIAAGSTGFDHVIASAIQEAPGPNARLANAGSERGKAASPELREAFQDFVGQTFFGQMIQALRKTQQESKYFHGGQAERIFQAQFDQTLAEQLSESSADRIADPMFELFQLGRPS